MLRRKGLRHSPYQQLRRRAEDLVNNLRVQIRKREVELVSLRAEEQRLAALSGLSVSRAASAGRRGARRTNWGAVLSRLPKEFKAADVHKRPGLQTKRSSEVFAAITRWIEAGLVKRKSRGEYVRVK